MGREKKGRLGCNTWATRFCLYNIIVHCLSALKCPGIKANSITSWMIILKAIMILWESICEFQQWYVQFGGQEPKKRLLHLAFGLVLKLKGYCISSLSNLLGAVLKFERMSKSQLSFLLSAFVFLNCYIAIFFSWISRELNSCRE